METQSANQKTECDEEKDKLTETVAYSSTSNNSTETEPYDVGESDTEKDNIVECDNSNAKIGDSNAKIGDSNSECNDTKSDKDKKMTDLRLDFQEAFQSSSAEENSEENVPKGTVQKGDHVLMVGLHKKLPAVVGDKLDEEFIEVNFYSKTKEKGWAMLEVLHVVKLEEIEKVISPPKINYVSQTRAFLEFEGLDNIMVTESSDTSFYI